MPSGPPLPHYDQTSALSGLPSGLIFSPAYAQTFGQAQLGLQQGCTTACIFAIWDGTTNVSIGTLNTVAHTFANNLGAITVTSINNNLVPTGTGSSTIPIGVALPMVPNGSNQVAFPNEPANTVLAGPASGAAAQPAFRALGLGDLPSTGNVQVLAATPTGTTSLTGLMTGIGAIVTPARTGTYLVVVSSNAANSTTLDGCQIQIRWGNGTAPVNGGALVGTPVGNLAATTAGITKGSLTANAIVTPTGGGPYWFDISQAAITAGTCTLSQVSLSALEE